MLMGCTFHHHYGVGIVVYNDVVKEELWSPYSMESAPCLVKYDYVVHLEDREELEFFLKISNLTSAGSDLTRLR